MIMPMATRVSQAEHGMPLATKLFHTFSRDAASLKGIAYAGVDAASHKGVVDGR
ncbi:hypothetical protein DPMN_041644 [Dreissena polymorpha]|uniref:Uncharacterized protein n=1 Tax=Dreissena polymorpha TaxID=45954 RepID=A0A9D4CXL5_DREPO|nr:hypothetical protein DPMN_041644 [Dreissena polymorpha]